ncbi:MAG: chemotaxis protein CheW [Sulfurimonas sp.]|nr:chemotaxis protein CheW [Sulfurimonas sp.]
MQIVEILIIKNGTQSFGISTEDISQIFRVPSIMQLPIKPYEVRGLSAVGGNIANVLDLNLLLQMPQVDISDEKSRLLTLTNDKSTNALLVSEVYNTAQINKSKIEYINRVDDSIVAIYKHENFIIQILSLNSLFDKVKRVDIKSKIVNNGKIKADVVIQENSKRFLIFKMENEKFALELDYLREIILADINFTEILGSADEIVGLIALRDDLITVIDLRLYYKFNQKENDKNRILIVMIDNKTIGLLVDEILDIRDFINEDIDYMKDELEKNKIAGVLHDKESLISFLDDKVLKIILNENEAYVDSNDAVTHTQASDENFSEFILFELQGKEYSFEVDIVAEIIDFEKSTDVAYTNDCVSGIINIRGQIVPIVSLENILNIDKYFKDDSKIIVCNIDNTKVGFVVDNVSDILSIAKEEIISQDDNYLTDVLHLDNGKRLVLKMDIQKIIKEKSI